MGDVEGRGVPVGSRTGGHTAPGIVGMGAYGPGDCRTDRHRVPDGKRLSGTESPGYVRGAGQRGSRQRGAKPQNEEYGTWLQDRRVTWGSQAARVPEEYCRWVWEDIRCSGYRSPVAGGEEMAGGEEVAAGGEEVADVRVLHYRRHLCSSFPSGVSGFWHLPSGVSGYDTPLPWH